MTDTVFLGNILTMDDEQLVVEAALIRDDRIIAVGTEAEVRSAASADARVVHLGDDWLMPGLIEPHGHPVTSAVMLGGDVIDIRPVVIPTADGVLAALRAALAERTPVFLNGWDPLLQRGLPTPDIRMLDEMAGDIPLVILHNSGHAAYFNTAAARRAGIDDDTVDPSGARYGRDGDGHLNGVAMETAAVQRVCAPALQAAQQDFTRLFRAHSADLSSRGITTVSEMGWDPVSDPALRAVQESGGMTVRLRLYEMSRPGGSATPPVHDEDDMLRHVGVKLWSDGSPWTGNIATTFPYLDSAATRAMGLGPHHRGRSNFTTDEIVSIAEPYVAAGWQLACHAHGDVAISETLDAFEALIRRHDLQDHRFRLEHVGSMTPPQFVRAAGLGVTVSVFVDHLYYWGEVLVDDLFGPEHGGRWADAASAFEAGTTPTFHNDGWVTPNEPFRNMATAETRTTRSGRRLEGAAPVRRVDALAAHTRNAAWQLFDERSLGTISAGKRADVIIVDRDPLRSTSEELANTVVLATVLDGAVVFRHSRESRLDAG